MIPVANVKCKTANLSSGVEKLGYETVVTPPAVAVENCAEKLLANGLVTFVDATLVTCANSTGHACVLDVSSGVWFPRSSLSADRADFRTVGKAVGTDISDADITCYDENKERVVEGSSECWAYEITS